MASLVLSDDEDSCADVKCTVGEYCKGGKCHCYDYCPQDWYTHQAKVSSLSGLYFHTTRRGFSLSGHSVYKIFLLVPPTKRKRKASGEGLKEVDC